METKKEVFAERLRELLEKSRLSQKDFAEAIGENPSTVNAWLREANMPRLPKVQKVAEYFGVSPLYLLDRNVTVDFDEEGEKKLIGYYRSLNRNGRKQALIQVKNLGRVPEYRNGGQDTLIAASGAEGFDSGQLEALGRDIQRALDFLRSLGYGEPDD